LEIIELPTSRLEEMKELWRGLYEHHTSILPNLREREVPFEQAWEKRRQSESRWLTCEPQSFVLTAQDGGRPVGYAYVRIRSAAGFVSSWSVCDPLAELAILAVAAERRGEGIGSMLLDAVDQRLGQMGIEDMLIGVIATNEDAMRLYEGRGAKPFLTDFIQRVSKPQD
jgi:ribosomal protein S18 acetylase RimI-like enzyme